MIKLQPPYRHVQHMCFSVSRMLADPVFLLSVFSGNRFRPSSSRWPLAITSLFFVSSLLFGIWLLPISAVSSLSQPVRGYGGGRSVQSNTPIVNQKVCGSPATVFQTFGFSIKDVPGVTALKKLLTPQQQPVQKAGDVSYDPVKGELCTIGWMGIYTRYVQSHSMDTNVLPSTVPSGDVGANWVQDILNGLFSSFAHGLNDFFQGVLTWAKTFGFLFFTPDGLTYHQPVVAHLHAWMVGVMDSILVLVLVISGYHTVLGQSHLLRELAPRLLFAGIAGTGSLFFITQFIEVQNALCTGFLGALATAGVGNLSLPLGIINWATAPEYEVFTYLIDVVMSVLLCIQMLVRIGLLDFLIVVAPFGLLCFALPHTLAWGRLWVQAFVSTLLLQFFQTVCIGLGTVLITSFGHATYSVISILVGIATLYIAFKLPGMLLSNVLRASVGDVHRDIGRAAQAVAEQAILHKA
ncbi:hypothetical protein [Dictyobacter kobayashii]|uniref:hypothetical protein n=1 Tax=Dictyobacter kobayashii TaxID=2014872 RepID=UPI0013867775|nr:hypothetical protein [Dictyobacter kobayashii]